MLLKRVRALERFERTFLSKVPHLAGDQILLASKGADFDLLIRGTVDSLYQIAQKAPGLLPEDLALIAAGWTTQTFPRTPSVPDGDFDAETFTALETIFDDWSRTIVAGKPEAR